MGCGVGEVRGREDEVKRLAHIVFALIPLLLVAGFALELRTVRAQGRGEAEELLRLALRRAVATADGRAPVRHCRFAGPAREGDERWSRCDRRMGSFARLFVEAGEIHQVDPWLLAAVASRESGLNPWASGAAGEVGLMQLHPRGIGRELAARFARAPVRARCDSRADACQRPVIDRGAAALRRALERCGAEMAGLSAHNTGRCDSEAGAEYARRALRRREQLQAWARAAAGPGPATAAPSGHGDAM